MRWIFLLLLLVNAALLVWRLVGLPKKYLKPVERPPYQLPLSVQRVSLLSEQNTDPLASDTTSVLSQGCRLVGPFPGRQEADVFYERLRVLDVKGKIKSISSAAGETYWVYLDSFGSRARAKKELEKLHARGIDSYIMAKGELANGISLGVFSELALADARLTDLTSRGLSPKIKSVPRVYDQWWVEVSEKEVQKIAPKAWSTLLRDPFELKEKQKSCLDVASS